MSAGGLSSGQLPGALERMERQIPRYGAALLERGWRHAVGIRHAPERLQRSVPGRRAQALRQHQFYYLPRRLQPPRPGQLQREAQRRQRRAEPGRGQRQRQLELRRRGPTDDPAITARAGSRSAISSPRCSCPKVCRCSSPETNSATRNRATIPYCQDNELTWLPWELTEEQQVFCDFVRQVLTFAARSRFFSAGSSSRGAQSMARTSKISRGLIPPARR